MSKQPKQPTADILDFMSEIDSLLKKDKTLPTKKGQKVKVALPVKPHRYERLTLNKSFTPRERLVIITRQSCACCGDSTEYVSQPLKTFSNKRLASISIPDPDESLPLVLREEFTSVPKCATCLRIEQGVELWIEDVIQHPQLSLFQ
jgi:hypothetical protein